jgi:hypothetical protein
MSNSGAVEFELLITAAAARAWLDACDESPAVALLLGDAGVRANASSMTVRKSVSIFRGCPVEYSAWNITFQEWQIMRRRLVGSWWEKWARRQSSV